MALHLYRAMQGQQLGSAQALYLGPLLMVGSMREVYSTTESKFAYQRVIFVGKYKEVDEEREMCQKFGFSECAFKRGHKNP